MHKARWILFVILIAALAGVGVTLVAARSQEVQANPPHPLLSDVRIRQALAYCTDRAALAQSVYGFLSQPRRQELLMDTFLPKTHWAYHAPDPAYTYPFSPTLGVQLLEQAGWSLAPGADYRSNAAGYELAVELTTTTAAFRQTWVAELQNQLRQNCGIHLLANHISGGVLFGTESGLTRREFELAGFAWVGELDPGGESLYACDQIPSAENGWVGQNYMGWCNPVASQAIERANNTLERQEKIAQYAIVQDEFTRDMPSLPLFQRVLLSAADANLQGFVPDPVELTTWNVYSWTIPGANTIRIGYIYQPASLFPPEDTSTTAQSLQALVYGRPFTTLNYDYQPRLYTSMPTLENGGAYTRTVAVGAGTVVMNAHNQVGPLVVGMQVYDHEGQLTIFAGGTLSMTQIVVTGSYLPGLEWPDGSPLVMADLQLWDTINCNPMYANTYGYGNYCAFTVGREYLNNTTVRTTLAPGYVNSGYQVILPGAYPSERTLGDGRKLKNVPVAEWAALPEMAEYPWGLGPYTVSNWIHGNRIIFTRNPHFALGLPPTPIIEAVFLDEAGLDAGLIDGSIDVADWNSLGWLSQGLLQAEQDGLLTLHTLAGPTWEHIDMNFELYRQVVAIPVSSAGGVITTSTGLEAEFPAGTFTSTVNVVYNQRDPALYPGAPGQFLQAFSLEASLPDGTPVTQLQQAITLTVSYTDEDLAQRALDEHTLNLAYWNGSTWSNLLPCTGCSLDTVNNRITVRLEHLSDFALLSGDRLFLPLLRH